MVVELWTKMIILGKKKFKDVPKQLQEKVKQSLIEQGKIDLIKGGN